MAHHGSVLERVAPLTGVAFALMAVAGGILSFGDAEFLGSGEQLAAHFVDNRTMIWWGTGMMTLSVPLLLWFMGSLWRRMRMAEGENRRLSVVALGGGVATGASLLVGAMAWTGAAARASQEGALDPVYGALAYDLGGFLWGGAAPVALATVLLAFAVSSARTGTYPMWWAWVSGVLGVAHLILPISWMAFMGGLAWILVMGIWMTMENRGGHGAPTTTGTTTGRERAPTG